MGRSKNKSIIFLAVMVLASAANAYTLFLNREGNPRHWDFVSPDPAISTNILDRRTHAVRYYLAADGYSGTNAAAELAAVRAAFAAWQSVPGTCVRFEDAGTVAPPVDGNTDDDTNVVYWARTNVLVNKGRNNINGSLAVTYLSYATDSHEILQGDIAFNGMEHRWLTSPQDPAGAAADIGSVALHEIGHFLGLAHSAVGGSTMFFRGEPGINLQSRLSADDIAGLRALYPASPDLYGQVRGRVTCDGRPVLGAALYLEDPHGNIAASGLSWTNGSYDIGGLTPGGYTIRVAPLDPNGPMRLCDGRDIITPDSGTVNNLYTLAQTEFQPGPDIPLTVRAGVTNELDFAVAGATPAFRITRIRKPTPERQFISVGPLPVSLVAGQSNVFVGVASADLPTNGVTFSVTGDGVVMGSPSISSFSRPSLHVISAVIDVEAGAAPGLRSFVVRQGANAAWANGFLEIRSPAKNYNPSHK